MTEEDYTIRNRSSIYLIRKGEGRKERREGGKKGWGGGREGRRGRKKILCHFYGKTEVG
jgi:hypothetical protein